MPSSSTSQSEESGGRFSTLFCTGVSPANHCLCFEYSRGCTRINEVPVYHGITCSSVLTMEALPVGREIGRVRALVLYSAIQKAFVRLRIPTSFRGPSATTPSISLTSKKAAPTQREKSSPGCDNSSALCLTRLSSSSFSFHVKLCHFATRKCPLYGAGPHSSARCRCVSSPHCSMIV